MTPAARVAIAIEVLDVVLDGASAEKTLTTWARRSRFAGSGDRAAIRDLVFDALRCRRSYGWLGGSDTGRGLMVGALLSQGTDPATVFTGEGYAPPPLNDAVETGDLATASLPVRLDIPDWLQEPLADSLGDDCGEVLQMMQARAPVFLRVNLKACTRVAAQELLQGEMIETAPHVLSPGALIVLMNPRKVQSSIAFQQGWVEVQDAASQAIVDALDVPAKGRILDYCAGGGGKALGIAARSDAQVFAHDVDPARMQDIATRATRAGVDIAQLESDGLQAAAPFDLVLCDAPCSGSGAWRRSPEAKWRISPDRLKELCALQAEILDTAALLVAPGGTLAYATCSLLDAENRRQIDAFLQRNPLFNLKAETRLTPLDGGDGFYLAQLLRLTALP